MPLSGKLIIFFSGVGGGGVADVMRRLILINLVQTIVENLCKIANVMILRGSKLCCCVASIEPLQ